MRLIKTFISTALLSSVFLLPVNAFSQSNSLTGVGQIKISGDKKSIPAIAEAEAKRDLVRVLLKQAIGAERVGSISDATITSLANQILPEMIISKNAEKIGDTFKVTIIADIDRAWFNKKLDDEGINNSVQNAGASNQLMFIMIEQKSGIGRDYTKPQQISTDITHDIGAEYSDKSATVYKDAEASNQHASNSAAYNAGLYSVYGGGNAAANAHSANSSSYNAATSYSDKTDVQANMHDNFAYHQTISYQKPPSGSSGSEFALSALSSNLISHGVELAAPDLILSKFFSGSVKTYSELKTNVLFSDFLKQLSNENAPFFMGGTMEIRDTGRDSATNGFMCSGTLDSKAFDTISSKIVASGVASATAISSSAEDCEAQLGEKLALLASNDLGPQIQNYWRKKSRDTNNTIAAAEAGGDYTIVLQGGNLSLGLQTDFLDALEHTNGVKQDTMIASAQTQMSFRVKYEGDVPIHLSIYKQLRSSEAFKDVQVKSEGRLITFCLSNCK